MAQICDVLDFQVEKRLFSLGKKALEELEKLKNYAAVLEKIMDSAGFEDPEYKKSEELFRIGRKLLLDETNSSNRELKDLITGKFDIKLKN